MTQLTKEEIEYLNKRVPVDVLLRHFHGICVSPNQTFRCPYHDDEVSSAKLFGDNAFFCFACQKQYTPYRILRKNGYSVGQIKLWVFNCCGVPGAENSKCEEEERIYRRRIGQLQRFVCYSRQMFKKNSSVPDIVSAWVKFEREIKGVRADG